MRKLNLLHELKNIRNTITPDTPLPGDRAMAGKRGLLLGLSLVAVLAVGAVFLWSQKSQTKVPHTGDMRAGDSGPAATPNSLLAEDEAGLSGGDDNSPLLADANTPAPDEVEPPKKPPSAGSPPKKRALASPIKPVKPEPVTALPEKAPIKPIMSRPVAKEAASQRKPPGIAGRKTKAGQKGDIWSVRFALCVMERSCKEIVGKLKRQGIYAFMVEGEAVLTMREIVIGHWRTAAGAKAAREELSKSAIKLSLFTSGGGFYLTTGPIPGPMAAEQTLATIRLKGYRAEKVSKKAARKVYKVYEGAYNNKENANKRLSVYKKRGIDCIVEKRRR